MKKFPFAMIALSAGLILAGCSDPVAPASSSIDPGTSSSSSSSSTPAPVEVTINVSKDIPGEFAISGSFDLDDYVTVTGVSSYDVEVVSGPVAVNSDHVVTASGYGKYLIRVSAGGESADISGQVISDGKAKINSIFGEPIQNWTSVVNYGANVFYTFRNEHYYAAGSYTDSTYSAYVYEGIVEAPNGNNYAFSYQTDLENVISGDVVWSAGIDTNMVSHGYPALSIDPALLEEVFDRDGNPMNYYVLDDQETIAEITYYAIGLEWEDIVYTYGVEKILISIKEDGSLLFEMVNLNYFPLDSLNFELRNIGSTKIAELDAWYASPVYPEKIDVTDVKTLLNLTKTEKNYHMSVYGFLTNATQTQIYYCPTDMYNGDVPVLFAFVADIYVDDNTIYTDVSLCQPDVPDFYKENGLAANTATYYSVNPNGGADTTYGTITRADETAGTEESVEWGSTVNDPRGPAPFESRWTTGTITDEMVDAGNYRVKGTTTTGSDMYIFDNIADDGALQRSLFQMGGRGGYYLYNNLTQFSTYPNFEDYFTSSFITSGTTDETTGVTTLDTLQYQSVLQYNSRYSYYYVARISDIGSAVIPHSPVVAA